jgi:hypothetical protein
MLVCNKCFDSHLALRNFPKASSPDIAQKSPARVNSMAVSIPKILIVPGIILLIPDSNILRNTSKASVKAPVDGGIKDS